MPLTIEKVFQTSGTSTMKITGFTEDELNDLAHIDYQTFKEEVLNALDKRNNGKGKCWKCGYGVYQMWIRDNAVYAEIGNSCD